jgi:hypothetical protein
MASEYLLFLGTEDTDGSDGKVNLRQALALPRDARHAGAPLNKSLVFAV